MHIWQKCFKLQRVSLRLRASYSKSTTPEFGMSAPLDPHFHVTSFTPAPHPQPDMWDWAGQATRLWAENQVHGQRALVCGGWGGVDGTEWYSDWTLMEWYGWPNGSKATEFCCRGLEYCQESLNSLQTNKTKFLKKLLIDTNVNFCDLSFSFF